MDSWKHCKNILCIRADNMGDLIMTTPAFRALKESFGCNITLLTSKAGGVITNNLEDIDDVIIQDLPWVKCADPGSPTALLTLAEQIRALKFDAAIIFTVYSQSALPAAMLAYMAGIPNRLSFARENPYELLTDWLPDREPFEFISHQVERDLALVAHIGAVPSHDLLSVQYRKKNWKMVKNKLLLTGINISQSWILLHPGVSEEKRKYPVSYWIKIGKILSKKYTLPLLITGSESEKELTDEIASGIGKQAFSMAGVFSVEEFIIIIAKAKYVISVNTGTIHIAAATQTPLVVLYAQTNPQHIPWKSIYRLLPFSVPENLKSNNTIVRYVSDLYYPEMVPYPTPEKVVATLEELMEAGTVNVSEEKVSLYAA